MLRGRSSRWFINGGNRRMLLMYRTYRSVRYLYWGCTELTEVCGTGMKVCTGTGGTGIDVPNLMKCPVPVLMSYRIYRSIQYRYWCGTELTEVSGSGIDDVPDLPKCPVPVRKSVPIRAVPVSMSYRTYRSIRYRCACRTELTEVSGTGTDVVPNLMKCPVPVIPPVYTAGIPRYVMYRTHPWYFACHPIYNVQHELKRCSLINVFMHMCMSNYIPETEENQGEKELTQSTIDTSFLYLLPSWTLLVYIFPLITCCILIVYLIHVFYPKFRSPIQGIVSLPTPQFMKSKRRCLQP